MQLLSWLDGLKLNSSRRQTKRGALRSVRRRRAGVKLSLETLEDRSMPSFVGPVSYGVAAYPLDMVVGDFNSDGKADLATINDTQLSLLPGNGDGTFGAAQTTAVGSGMRSVAAGDFNGDGRLDLVITSSVTTWNGTIYVTTGSALLLLNNTASPGPVTFQAARSFSTGTNLTPGAVAVGDLNGDGKADVAAVEAGGSNVTVLQGDGAGNLDTARQFAVGSNPVSVAVGDIDGDGRLDLVTANQGSNNLSVLLNGGNDGTRHERGRLRQPRVRRRGRLQPRRPDGPSRDFERHDPDRLGLLGPVLPDRRLCQRAAGPRRRRLRPRPKHLGR